MIYFANTFWFVLIFQIDIHSWFCCYLLIIIAS